MKVASILALLGFAAGCHDTTGLVCPAILNLRPTVPDTTTIKVGASTIAIAGATWGGCETGPRPGAFRWTTSDSLVATVTTLDSIHARILGLRPGQARITPVYLDGRTSPMPAWVTVVP